MSTGMFTISCRISTKQSGVFIFHNKTLLLKIYYELDEFDLLQAHLDAMQNYILRKKVIGYHKTNYLNTIRYTKRLLSLNYYDKVSIKKLRKKLDEEEILTEKRWMLSQLER